MKMIMELRRRMGIVGFCARAQVGQALLRVLEESGEQVDVAAAWAVLEQVATRDRIFDAVAKIGELVPDTSGVEGAMREQMARRFRTVGPFLRLPASTPGGRFWTHWPGWTPCAGGAR